MGFMNGLGLGYPNPVRHPPLEARTRGVSWYGQPSSSLGLGWATRLPGPRDRLEMLGTYVGIINPGGIVPFFWNTSNKQSMRIMILFLPNGYTTTETSQL